MAIKFAVTRDGERIQLTEPKIPSYKKLSPATLTLEFKVPLDSCPFCKFQGQYYAIITLIDEYGAPKIYTKFCENCNTVYKES